MNNGNELVQSRRSLRHTREAKADVDRPVDDLGPVRSGGRRDRRRQSTESLIGAQSQDPAAPGAAGGQVNPFSGEFGMGDNDPTAAHNLSVFSPRKFIKVLWAPRTGSGTTSAAGGGTLDADPIGARSAHGLEPLDAMTAGLARVRRRQLLQYSIVSLGALALVVGIIMITGVLN